MIKIWWIILKEWEHKYVPQSPAVQSVCASNPSHTSGWAGSSARVQCSEQAHACHRASVEILLLFVYFYLKHLCLNTLKRAGDQAGFSFRALTPHPGLCLPEQPSAKKFNTFSPGRDLLRFNSTSKRLKKNKKNVCAEEWMVERGKASQQ